MSLSHSECRNQQDSCEWQKDKVWGWIDLCSKHVLLFSRVQRYMDRGPGCIRDVV